MIDAEPQMRLVPHQVPYTVENPRYVELDDLLKSAEIIAPSLWSSGDTPFDKGPLAWSGGTAEESFARVDALRARARLGASNVVERIRAARDRESPTLTKYRTEWFWERTLD